MIGERIRLLRKQNNITMKELGQMLTLGESTISMYENEKREPDYNTLVKIADYFNVSTDYILGNSDDPTPPNKKNNIPQEKLKLLNGIGYAYYGGEDKDLDEDDVDDILRIVDTMRQLREKRKKDDKK